MKRIVILLLAAVLLICTGCQNSEPQPTQAPLDVNPELSQMKAICEWAVLKCYYHNVAKYYEEKAEGMLWWEKDKHFWVEYGGIVTVGVDASLIRIEVEDTLVTVTIPEAKIFACEVDSASLNDDSFIVARNSAKVTAEDHTRVFAAAQETLRKEAESNRTLLANAQQRAQMLLEGYITNIGDLVGKQYVIRWIYTDAEGNPLTNDS